MLQRNILNKKKWILRSWSLLSKNSIRLGMTVSYEYNINWTYVCLFLFIVQI